ncbi:MAG: hypothetical protein HYU02_01070 [Thaumarchaeota archaeon]|nr:hypothetical protein [Nitrososphaerota archaeon]
MTRLKTILLGTALSKRPRDGYYTREAAKECFVRICKEGQETGQVSQLLIPE